MVEHLILVTVKVAVLLLGASIALLAFLAYRRTRVPLMLALAVAFSLVGVGTFAEGLLFEIFRWDLSAVHVIESAFILLGLSTLAILLRPRRNLQPGPESPEAAPREEGL